MDSFEAPDRNAQRISRLRAQIIETGIRMFCEQGFDSVTVSDIAAAAGVSRRSMFRYFATKEDILFNSIDEDEHAFMRETLAGFDPGIPPAIRLRQAFLTLADRTESRAAGVRLKARLIFGTPALAARMHHDVMRWQSDFYHMLCPAGASLAEPARFTHRVRIAITATAYITALRHWADQPEDALFLPYVQAAFTALDEMHQAH